MKENKTKKPYCLRKSDAAAEITDAICRIANENRLSYCDLEDILFKINTAVAQSANRERDAAMAEYQKAVKAAEKEQIGGDDGGT